MRFVTATRIDVTRWRAGIEQIMHNHMDVKIKWIPFLELNYSIESIA